MLTAVIHRPNKIDIHCEWEPGGEPISPRIFGLHGEIVQVRAFGSALEWIRKHITGIRMTQDTTKEVVNWVGEDAVFILNNLPRPIASPHTKGLL